MLRVEKPHSHDPPQMRARGPAPSPPAPAPTQPRPFSPGACPSSRAQPARRYLALPGATGHLGTPSALGSALGLMSLRAPSPGPARLCRRPRLHARPRVARCPPWRPRSPWAQQCLRLDCFAQVSVYPSRAQSSCPRSSGVPASWWVLPAARPLTPRDSSPGSFGGGGAMSHGAALGY